MKQTKDKISVYNKIRRNLYLSVERGEQSKRNKLILASLAVLLVASILLFTAALIATSEGKSYTYVYGNYEQKINTELAFANDVQYIDMNALANYCGFEKSSFFTSSIYQFNGTEVSFENGNNIATINGISVEMPAVAVIENGYALVPLSVAQDIIYGINITVDTNQTHIAIENNKIYMIANNIEVEYETDISAYIQYINSKNDYIYTLTNKQNAISDDFEPDNLVNIPAEYRRKDMVISLYIDAEKALEAMIKDMRASGITDAYVQSAYRTYSYQKGLFNNYVNTEMANGLSYDEAVEKVNKYSARPEFSEHRTGLCLDFTTSSIGGVVDDIFETTDAFRWLVENSWKYGFILRYPKDKYDIVQYQYESWHYRFVGLEVASIMHQTGLCYEEYLDTFTK